jgi:hypothetical protein
MGGFKSATWRVAIKMAGLATILVAPQAVSSSWAGPANVPDEVTYSQHIAPILQRSCEKCHRPGGGGPMPFQNYEQVRPWARAIKTRTGIGPKAGVMPPWYVERNIGIQKFKNDPSLSPQEIAMIAKWADSGAPRGNDADMPAPRVWDGADRWVIGTPDLIVKTTDIVVKANTPDWWGEIQNVPTGLTEDRYVVGLEVKEVNDSEAGGGGRETVGALYVFHHLIWSTRNLNDQNDVGTSWPVHEVGREADFFDPNSARLLKAGSSIVSDSAHLHSNGRDTKSHLEIGFKFAPRGFKPAFRRSPISLGNGVDIDISGMESNQQLHAYAVLPEHTKVLSFEPHLHAPGTRMCLEAIWGHTIQTLSCVGYDHNWVRGYNYADDAAPLLPKGTILHIIGYMDNTPANRNVPDPRNWSGSGNRSITNMFLDLGNRVSLTDEQFQQEMAERRQKLGQKRSAVIIGCPLCNVELPAATPAATSQGQQQQ